MNDLLKNEYIHYGTDEIRRELWLKLDSNNLYQYNIKPKGGIWASKLSYGLGEWTMYIKNTTYFWDDLLSKNYCIVKFKENSKLFCLNNIDDFNKYLKEGYIIKLDNTYQIKINHYNIDINYVLNFDKISKNFDLLYINPLLSNDFLIYRVPTMLSINPDNIEYYKPLQVNVYNETYKVLDIKKIKPYHKNYITILNIIKEEITKNNKEIFKNYDNITKEKINIILEKIKDINIDVDKEILIKNTIRNHYAKILTLKK